MKKRAGLTKNIKGITFVELLISLIVVSIMVLSFYSLETYGHRQVMIADRRVKVQNDLAYALEHMSKYIQKANGNTNNPAIEILTGTSFKVRVDFRDPQIPSDLSNAWVTYSLVSNSLSANCDDVISGTCPSADAWGPTLLSNRITTFTPTLGAAPLNNIIEIDLVGLYDPLKPISNTGVNLITRKTEFVNPQVAMKTKIICNSSSSN